MRMAITDFSECRDEASSVESLWIHQVSASRVVLDSCCHRPRFAVDRDVTPDFAVRVVRWTDARPVCLDDTLSIAGQTVSAPFAYIRNTAATCVLGAPGLTIPIGLGISGLPMGLELDAIPGADSRSLALGRVARSILGPCPPPHTALDARGWMSRTD
jgi:hypothetical protein